MNKYISYFLLIVLVIITQSVVISQDIDSDLLLYYSFDQIKTDTIVDGSGNDHFGIMKGAARQSTGFEDQGLLCLNKADYILAPDNINSEMTSFTFSSWVRVLTLKNATRFFDWGSGSEGSNNFIAFIPSFGGDNEYMNLRFRPTSGTAYNVTSTKKCPVGSWAHVAVTYEWNGSSGTATLYLNGEMVGSGSSIPYNPSAFLGDTTDNYFGYSRWSQDANGFAGLFDELRVYTRALDETDIISLAGLGELFEQHELLDLGDLTSVTGDLTFPTELGDQGVSVSWNTSDNSLIDASGAVTRPDRYDRCVTITATLSFTLNGVIYYREKSFVATVKGMLELPGHICRWNFDHGSVFMEQSSVLVKDKTDSEYVGEIKNDASIRTIGETKQFNVLYMGNGNGYFDMGTEVGEAIYALKDHTIMGYFRVDADYTDLGRSGNFFYTFSNTEQADADQTGYIAGRLNVTGHQCTKYNWDYGKEELALGWSPVKDTWHHYAYVQEGETGKLYIDGSLVKQGDMKQLPSVDIALPSREGTLFNWLGRSVGLPSDVFLRKTMVYDFNVFSKALSEEELTTVYGVSDTLAILNLAYAENADYRSPELLVEYEDLDPGDLSAVIADIDLPVKGSTHPEVSISWYSSQSAVIENSGKVTRPDFFDYDLQLTAVLKFDLYTMTKTFPATVLATEGTYFSEDLLVRFDFSNVEEDIVKDIAEKELEGSLVNGAKVVSMGTGQGGIYNVLNLGAESSYFDLGEDVGKIVSRLDDFSMGAFYFVNDTYAGLTASGNMLWTFANNEDITITENGFLMGSLKDQGMNLSTGSNEESGGLHRLSFERRALKGSWHHLAFTQDGKNTKIYIDGVLRVSGMLDNTLSESLLKQGIIATSANWIGRSCIPGDVYLQNALVYDFRIYNRALTQEEIAHGEFQVVETLPVLEAARKSFLADSKIAESSPLEKRLNPEPDYLEILIKDGSWTSIPLSSLERISFPEELTKLSMLEQTDSTYSSAEIRRMKFTVFKTSMEEKQTVKVILYPNPADEFILIDGIEMSDNRIIEIYNVAGRSMKRQILSEDIQEIDISDLPSGIYFVRSGNYSAKFVKQ